LVINQSIHSIFNTRKIYKHIHVQNQLPTLFNFPEINVGALFCVYTLKPITMELSSSNTSSIGIGGDGGSGGGGGDKGCPKSKGGGGSGPQLSKGIYLGEPIGDRGPKGPGGEGGIPAHGSIVATGAPYGVKGAALK
jgi:hypothetical protein